jgi:hypothetical protein
MKLQIKENIHLEGFHPLQEPLKTINYTKNGDVENGIQNNTK